MTNKINLVNLVEILKRCPEGMEFDCTIFEGAKLSSVSDYNRNYPIRIVTKSGIYYNLTKYGQIIDNEDAKCVIFPKGGNSWKDFQSPFKNGVVVWGQNSCCSYIVIYKSYRNLTTFNSHAGITSFGTLRLFEQPVDSKNLRLATEEEKEKLFEAMKERGFHWNEKTMRMEKIKRE